MTAADCPGCSWDGYVHVHRDAEDGPREECCAHTCGHCECPGCDATWSYHAGLCPWCIEACTAGQPHVPFQETED